jgi:hypothetical protein
VFKHPYVVVRIYDARSISLTLLGCFPYRRLVPAPHNSLHGVMWRNATECLSKMGRSSVTAPFVICRTESQSSTIEVLPTADPVKFELKRPQAHACHVGAGDHDVVAVIQRTPAV